MKKFPSNLVKFDFEFCVQIKYFPPSEREYWNILIKCDIESSSTASDIG